MKKQTITLIIVVIAVISSFAAPQRSQSDSLSKILRNPKIQDTARVNLQINLAKSYLKHNLDTAQIYFFQAKNLSEKLRYTDGIINSINGLGVCYWYQNKPELTIQTFQQALALSKNAGNKTLQTKVAGNLGTYYNILGITDSAVFYLDMAVQTGKNIADKNLYAKSLSDLGMVYYNKGKYLEALEKYIEATNQFEATKSYRDLTLSYNKLGMFYYDFHDFNKSVTYYNKALKTNALQTENSFEPTILQNLGLLYLELKKDYDTAAILLNKAMQMAMQKDNYDVELFARANLGNIAYEKKDYPTAIRIYLSLMESPVFNSRKKLKAAVLTNLGGAYFHLEEIDKALGYAREGLQLSEKHNFVVYQKSACKTLSEIAAYKKNYKLAYEYARRYATLQDTLGNAVIKQKATEALFKNALQQKENENLLLQKDNKIKFQTIRNQQLFMGLAAVALILGTLLLLVIIRNNRKQRVLNHILDQKNKELNDLNLTKAKLYSVIAHDLRSPFSGLMGILTELDDNFDQYNAADKHQMINILKRNSHNTYNLLVNLLDWTRLQQGNLMVQPVEFQPREVSSDVCAVLMSRAAAKNQMLNDETDDKLSIKTDPDILKSILLNLTNNAIKFSREGDPIIIRTVEGIGFIRFEVEDQGIGIPADEIKNLFRIDMKFQRKGTAKEPGTGLGLLMCKEFVGLLKGEIGVISKPDQGSIFWFTIPHNISLQN